MCIRDRHKALQDAVVVLRILQYNVADYVVAPKVDNYVAPYADTDELREDVYKRQVLVCLEQFTISRLLSLSQLLV